LIRTHQHVDHANRDAILKVVPEIDLVFVVEGGSRETLLKRSTLHHGGDF
jgi:hypothetical protein